MKKKIVVPIIIVIAFLIIINSGMVVTYPNEFTVIKQFGKIIDIREEAGLSFKIPFIQSAEKIENEVLLYDLAVSDVMTKDKKSMIADCFALWRIEDPQIYTQTLSAQKSNAELSERNNIAATYEAEGQEEAKEISNNTKAEIIVMQSEADAQAAEIIAKGEAEYMRILSEAYNDPEKADFYLFLRSLDAAKLTMTGNNKTLIIDETSPVAQIFY